MNVARRLLIAGAVAVALTLLSAGTALAQSSIVNSVSPEVNTGGWVYGMAWLIAILAFLVVIMIVVGYMRYAPRFAKDEESSRVVHADRVLPGREPPRRAVDLSQAVPIVVQPPALPAAVAAVGASVAAPAAAPAAAEAPPHPRAGPAARHPLPRRHPPLRPHPPRPHRRRPPQRHRRSASRSRWIKRSTTPRSPTCSVKARIAGSPKERLAGRA